MKGFWEKLEKIALFCLLLAIPTQLGKHFWPEWSHVLGVRVDYLSPVLYLVDTFWMGLFLVVTRRKILEKKIFEGELQFGTILVVVLAIVNILVAENRWIAGYRWIRLAQWWWMVKYCVENKQYIKNILKKILPVWIGGESLLGLAQMSKGSSIQGLMYWFGERRFSFTTIGVAEFSVLGKGLIRAYGTFSHPNSLAGFLLVSLAIWQIYYRKINKISWWAVNWLGILGIILSGSRTVWVLTIILMIINFFRVFKEKIGIKKIVGYMSILVGVVIIILSLVAVNYRTMDFVGGWDNDSLSKRIELNLTAISMWKDNFMLGVGAGNFVVKLPEFQSGRKFYWLQPAHNIFLLVGTEIGMLGVIMTVWFLAEFWGKKSLKRIWPILAIVVITGLADHYWITLPQNNWLLAVVLGLF